MKTHKLLTLALSLAISFSPLAVLKAASLIGMSYGAPIQSEIKVNSGDDVKVSAGSNSSTTVNHNPDARTNININGIENSQAGVNATSSAHANINSRVLSATQVTTDDDLKAFMSESIQRDVHLKVMTFTNDHLDVAYKDRGRFIGLIPMTITVNITVNQDGSVTYSYPWYAFLVVKPKADLEAKVQTEVEDSIQSRASGGWTNSDRAALAEHVGAALEAHSEAE